MSKSYVLLESHLKTLKLPEFLENYQNVAEASNKAENVSYTDYLQKLSEIEVTKRHNRSVEKKIKRANFPSLKTLDIFDFNQVPSLNKQFISELAICEYIEQKKNIIAIGNSGMGKTHIAIALGVAACQRGFNVGYHTTANLVHNLLEANEERRFLKLQQKLLSYDLLIIDELGYVPLSKAGAELLFDIFSGRYEHGSIIVTTNLPFANWTEVFNCPRLTGALLDRLTHHVHILQMNGEESYRLQFSKSKAAEKRAL